MATPARGPHPSGKGSSPIIARAVAAADTTGADVTVVGSEELVKRFAGYAYGGGRAAATQCHAEEDSKLVAALWTAAVMERVVSDGKGPVYMGGKMYQVSSGGFIGTY